MDNQLMSEAQSIAKGTFDSTMNYMNIGFAISAAMAWNRFAEIIIKQKLKISGGNSDAKFVIYPLLVTLIAVIVFKLSSNINPRTKKPMIVPIVQG